MRKHVKKVLSSALALALTFSSLPANDFIVKTFADDEVAEQLLQDDDGKYYYNFKRNDKTEFNLTDKEDGFTFNLYDTGGKDADYENSDNSEVRLIAPEGYGFMLSGKITCENSYNDFMRIYDVISTVDEESGDVEKTNQPLGNEMYGNQAGEKINLLLGNTNEMLVCFHADGSAVYEGFELKVTLFKFDREYGISFTNRVGGELKAYVDENVVDKAIPGTKVKIQADVIYGYSLREMIVEYSDGSTLEIEGGKWTSDNSVEIIMPGRSINITPVYDHSNNSDVLSLNFPKSGTKNITIAKGIDSFAVYDDGGKDGEYSDNADGTYVIRGPEGCRFEITGSVQTENYNDYLLLYDGEGYDYPIDKESYGNSDGEDIGIIISKDNVITVRFKTDGSVKKSGVDLKIRVFEASHEYKIAEKTCAGGKIEVTCGGSVVTSAKACSEIVVNILPDKGYALKDFTVKRKENDAIVPTRGGWSTNNIIKFEMPVSDIEITPVFAKVENGENFEVLIPKTGMDEVLISKEIQSFKVYEHAGKDKEYEDNCNGYLKLVAPEGYKFDVSGYVHCEKNADYLRIYDGDYEIAQDAIIGVLGKDIYGDRNTENGEAISSLISEGNVITLYFRTDGSQQGKGVDLDIKVFTTLSFNANGGNGEMEDVKLLGSLYTLPECEFTPVEGKKFAGWMIGDEIYNAGDDVVIGTNNEIKAVWKYVQQISFADEKIEKTFGDPNFTVAVDGSKTDVVYASDNEEVATVDANTGMVTIIGAGKCKISACALENDEYLSAETSCELEIKAKKLDNAMISEIAEQKYTGKVVTPEVVVKDGEMTLVKDRDYTVEYINNDKIGTATVVIIGIGNFTGSASINFEIVKAESDENTKDNKDNKDSNIKVGMKVSDRKYSYKVTKKDVNGKGGEVEIIGFKKKVLSKVKVAGVVKVNGVSYKVTSVGKKAFANKKIKSVFIGKNVKVIKAKAFFGNKKLKKVTIKSKVLKKVLKKAFFAKRKKKLVVKVPSKLKKKYSKVIKKSKSGKVKIK